MRRVVDVGTVRLKTVQLFDHPVTAPNLAAGALEVTTPAVLALEEGITVRFPASLPGGYRVTSRFKIDNQGQADSPFSELLSIYDNETPTRVCLREIPLTHFRAGPSGAPEVHVQGMLEAVALAGRPGAVLRIDELEIAPRVIIPSLARLYFEDDDTLVEIEGHPSSLSDIITIGEFLNLQR
jgi:hypothetical protein